MKKNIIFLIVFVLGSSLFQRCDVINQASQAINLVNCDFRIHSVENVNLAGVNVQHIIDDIRVASGNLHHSFTIPPNNGTAIIPMQITTDLKEILNGESLQSIVNFGLNLAGAGNEPTRFMVKLKPSILINGRPLSYPGYITVRTKYSSQ